MSGIDGCPEMTLLVAFTSGLAKIGIEARRRMASIGLSLQPNISVFSSRRQPLHIFSTNISLDQGKTDVPLIPYSLSRKPPLRGTLVDGNLCTSITAPHDRSIQAACAWSGCD